MSEQTGDGQEAAERVGDATGGGRRSTAIRLAVVLGGLFAIATAFQALVLLELAAARGSDPLGTVLRLGAPAIGLLGVGFGVGFVYLRRTLSGA